MPAWAAVAGDALIVLGLAGMAVGLAWAAIQARREGR